MSDSVSADSLGAYCPALTVERIRRGCTKGRYALTSIGLERRCSRCKEMWPADTEFFFAFHAPSSDGLASHCKACYREITDEKAAEGASAA